MTTKGQIHRFTPALCTAAAGLALSSSLAFATGGGGGGSSSHGFGDSAQIEIKGSIPPTCTFTTLPDQTSFGQIVTDKEVILGDLGFTCNIATSSSVSLTVKSANGALKRIGGNETVPYQILWAIQGATTYATIPTSPMSFALLSGTSGNQEIGAYKLKVTGPTAGVVAGYYKDLITYTIAP